MDWIIARLSEPSSWRGMIGVLTSAGLIISPELGAQIVAAGLALMGLINIFRKETK